MGKLFGVPVGLERKVKKLVFHSGHWATEFDEVPGLSRTISPPEGIAGVYGAYIYIYTYRQREYRCHIRICRRRNCTL